MPALKSSGEVSVKAERGTITLRRSYRAMQHIEDRPKVSPPDPSIVTRHPNLFNS